MTTYEWLVRVTSAIYTQGWGALHDSEETVLRNEPKMKAAVMAMLVKMRRASLLSEIDKTDSRSVPPLYIGDLAYSVDWQFQDVVREAELWRYGNNTVLEIKEWAASDYAQAIDIGAHEVIFQRRLNQADLDDLCAQVEDVLSTYDCVTTKAEIRQGIMNGSR
jgi:hypothetical protein